MTTVWLILLALAAIIVWAAAAVFLPSTGEAIAKSSGLDRSFVGTLLIATVYIDSIALYMAL